MLKTFQEALEENNRAVMAAPDAAAPPASGFASALAKIQSLLRVRGVDQAGNNKSTGSHRHPAVLDRAALRGQSLAHHQAEALAVSYFGQPLTFAGLPADADAASSNTLIVCAAALILNMAIACHGHSKKAALLYRKALACASGLGPDADGADEDVLVIQVVARTNLLALEGRRTTPARMLQRSWPIAAAAAGPKGLVAQATPQPPRRDDSADASSLLVLFYHQEDRLVRLFGSLILDQLASNLVECLTAGSLSSSAAA